MKKVRTSYIPNYNNKTNVTWPIITLVSFLIIIILIVMLLFSHFDTINTLINFAQIDKMTKELKVEYESSLMETEEVNEKLLELKKELVKLDETEGTKLTFYNDMSIIKNIKKDTSNNLYGALDTRSILKNNGDSIFVNDKEYLTILDSFLFNTNAFTSKKETDDFYQILAKRLNEVLNNDTYKKYVDYVYINSYTSSNPTESELLLSMQRGNKFKEELLNASLDLKNNFSSKIKVTIMGDSNLIYTKSNETEKNNRIEIEFGIDEELIQKGASNFVN